MGDVFVVAGAISRSAFAGRSHNILFRMGFRASYVGGNGIAQVGCVSPDPENDREKTFRETLKTNFVGNEFSWNDTLHQVIAGALR